jgi:K+-sensing histidine kinase KdpD
VSNLYANNFQTARKTTNFTKRKAYALHRGEIIERDEATPTVLANGLRRGKLPLVPAKAREDSGSVVLVFVVLVLVVSFLSGTVVVVVVSFVSGAVVVVVTFFSVVPAGAWANTVVTNAALINTVRAIINTFFIFFLLLGAL